MQNVLGQTWCIMGDVQMAIMMVMMMMVHIKHIIFPVIQQEKV